MAANALAFSFIERLAEESNSGLLDLPSFPDVALRIRDTLQKEDCNINDVVRLLNSEPAMTARILTVANSAMLSRSGAVARDLKVAVNRLGLDMVRNTAISVAMDQLTQAKKYKVVRPLLRQLWRHSVQVAATSYALSRKTKYGKPDEALLAGLMHDIGKLYIWTRAEEFPELLADETACEAITNDWHASIGTTVLQAWEFAEPLAQAAGGHENFDDLDVETKPLTTIVAVANFMVNSEKSLNATDLEPPQARAIASLGLTETTLAEVIVEAQEEIESLSAALKG